MKKKRFSKILLWIAIVFLITIVVITLRKGRYLIERYRSLNNESYTLTNTIYRVGQHIKPGRFRITSDIKKSGISSLEGKIPVTYIYNNIEKLPIGTEDYWKDKIDTFDVSLSKGDTLSVKGKVRLNRISEKTNYKDVGPGIYRVGINLPVGRYYWTAKLGVGRVWNQTKRMDFVLSNDKKSSQFKARYKVNLEKNDIIYSNVEKSRLVPIVH
ncbi:hypothetical protein [Levilactobacillus brevis]|uniref:hypothetical protein n=1 Tax=Levilactobacillus brevis TaxID=1580 RepID=UPI003D167326